MKGGRVFFGWIFVFFKEELVDRKMRGRILYLIGRGFFLVFLVIGLYFFKYVFIFWGGW